MKIEKIIACFLSLSFMNLFAQEGDLKKAYNKLTTAVNSSLITESGSIEISGSLSAHYYETRFNSHEDLKQQSILLEPSASYFFIDNVSLGIDFSYMNQKTDLGNSDGAHNIEQIFVGPLLKIYFTEKKLRPFIQTDYLFMAGDNYEGRVLDVGAGVFYHVMGNFGFNLFGKYGFMSSTDDQTDSQNRLFIGAGITNFIF